MHRDKAIMVPVVRIALLAAVLLLPGGLLLLPVLAVYQVKNAKKLEPSTENQPPYVVSVRL